MDLKKNDVFQVRIEDMSETGEGVGKLSGFIWFIKDAVVGDLVSAKVMKTKKSYGFARLVEILEASPARTLPLCQVAAQCGGCQLQTLDYREQLKYKENKVRNHLKRIGGFGEIVCCEDGDSLEEAAESVEQPIRMYPIIGMDNPWRYRNKAQIPFGKNKAGKLVAGFYASRTHSIVEQDDCLLGVEENQTVLECVKRYMEDCRILPYQEETHSGLVRHVLIRKGFHTGELMVCVVINGKKLPRSEKLTEQLMAAFSDFKDSREGSGATRLTDISYSVNMEKTNVIMGKDIRNLYGPGYIHDYIGEIQYRISPLSFYQVNPLQTEKLYDTALEYAQLTGGETVWDLYCGIGTISLFLAKKAKRVFGVELVPEAIADAKANAVLNDIKNVEFFVGKAEEVLPWQFEQNQIRADVIVVDPPRKGCDTLCLDTMVRMAPARIVYVSCDSATLARDLRYLADRGYRVIKVKCCDMFAQTVGCEVCCLLKKIE